MGAILIVDDERSMREFLRIALTRAGHKVEIADSPDAARAAYQARDFDLVITDLRMPGGSGLDVLDGVKAARPETQVVVVTAFATPKRRDANSASGSIGLGRRLSQSRKVTSSAAPPASASTDGGDQPPDNPVMSP